MYDSDEDSEPVVKSRKPKSTAKTRTSRPAPKSKAKNVIVHSDASDDEKGPSSAQPKPENTQDGDMAVADSNATVGGNVEEEEDEKSLFDPPPMPAPTT